MFEFMVFMLVLGFPVGASAGLMVVLALHARHDWAAPRCRKCSYDLRHKVPEDMPTCPECGADLNARRAILYGKDARVWWLVILAVVLAGWSHIGSYTLKHWQAAGSRSWPPPMAMGTQLPAEIEAMSTDELIEALATNPSDPYIWVLSIRINDGQIDASQIERLLEVREELRAKESPNSVTQFDGRMLTLIYAAQATGMLTDAQVAHHARLSVAKPLLVAIPRLRADTLSESLITVDFGASHAALMGTRHFAEVVDIQVNGRSVPFTKPPQSEYIRSRHHHEVAVAGLDLQPGKYKLEVHTIHGLMRSEDVVGLAIDAPFSQWARLVAQWNDIAVGDLFVLGKDEVAVRLIDHAELKPDVLKVLPGVTLRVRSTDAGLVLQRQVNRLGRLPLPLAFNMVLVAGDQRIDAGPFVAFADPSNALPQLNPVQVALPPLPAEIKQVDVIFEPAPQLVDSYMSVTEIWGEPIVFPNVPLDRVDLDVGKPAPPLQP